MQIEDDQTSSALARDIADKTIFSILLSISFSHLLNDTIQSLVPSIYPIVKQSFHLNFSQIGIITLVFQLTASLFQPLIGWYTDRKPQPYSLAIGMVFTLSGLILLSQSKNYAMLLVSVAVIGTGSSVFHPEASKVAYVASGGRRGEAAPVRAKVLRAVERFECFMLPSFRGLPRAQACVVIQNISDNMSGSKVDWIL